MRRGDLFVLSWESLRRVEWGKVSSFLSMSGGGMFNSYFQIGAGLYGVGRPVQKRNDEDGQIGTIQSLPLERGALFTHIITVIVATKKITHRTQARNKHRASRRRASCERRQWQQKLVPCRQWLGKGLSG